MAPKPRRVERRSASQNPEPIRPEDSHPEVPLSTIEGSPNPPEHSEDPSSYTKGKSRAETPQDEDADMADAEEDAETLRTLQKTRRQLEIRLKIQREQAQIKRIERELQDYAEGHESPHDSSEADPDIVNTDAEGIERGSKRSRADTTQESVHHPKRNEPSSKPPPRVGLENKYRGRNMHEYNTFMARMQNHFDQHFQYFTSDRLKISAAVAETHDDILLKWTQHKQETPTENRPWKEFQDFCLHLINDPKMLVRQMMQRYIDSRQTPDQSVRDFASRLKQIEQYLDPYSEKQRKEHLRAKVLPEIRNEILKYPDEPESYDSYIAHLHAVEESMPIRRNALRSAQLTRNSRSESRRDRKDFRSDSRYDRRDFRSNSRYDRRDFRSDSRYDRRDFQNDSRYDRKDFRSDSRHHVQATTDESSAKEGQQSKKCNYCHRKGHDEKECYIKQRERRSKPERSTTNSTESKK